MNIPTSIGSQYDLLNLSPPSWRPPDIQPHAKEAATVDLVYEKCGGVIPQKREADDILLIYTIPLTKTEVSRALDNSH